MIGLDVILGGVTGLIGNGISAFTTLKTKKLDYAHDEKMVDLNSKAKTEDAKMQIELNKNKIAGELDLKDATIYEASVEVGNQQTFSDKWIDKLFAVEGKLKVVSVPVAILLAFLFGVADFLRGIMRPGLTAYLVGMSTVITYMAWEIMQQCDIAAMTPDQAIVIFQKVISIIIYLTVSCVTWWFGDRRLAKTLSNKLDQ